MKKYLVTAVSAVALLTSAYSFAAAGPSLSKTLELRVAGIATLAADWTPVANLTNAAVKKATTIGTLNVKSKFVKSVTIASTKAADKALTGIVTFEKTDGGSFQTTLSSSTAGVTVSKATGNVTLAQTTAGGDLPDNVAVQFTTVASTSPVPAGNYNATINMTSVIL